MSNIIGIANMIGNQQGSSGPAFSPSDLSGLDVWLESDYGLFSDAGTTPAVADGLVQQWNSKTPASNNFAEATNKGTLKANIFNTLPAILFNGTKQLYGAITPAAASTIFLVVKSITFSDATFPMIYAAGAGIYQQAPTGYGWYATQGGGRAVITTAPATDRALIEVKFNSDSSAVGYSNGVEELSFDPSDGVGTVASAFLGYNCNCYIASFLRYTSALSDTDRIKVETYLQTKYGPFTT